MILYLAGGFFKYIWSFAFYLWPVGMLDNKDDGIVIRS